MFLKKIDFISPEITLYYKGSLSHSSIISGIISLIFLFYYDMYFSILFFDVNLSRKGFP